MAAIVAEVAAVEQFAPEPAPALTAPRRRRARAPPAAAAPPPRRPPPRRRSSSSPRRIARLRQQEAADAAEAAELSAEDAARLRTRSGASSSSATASSSCRAPICSSTSRPRRHEMDKQPLYDMAERVEQAMSNYGVRGKVKEIHMGPVVTMYEFAPAPGTRTGKIANLEKDLAMALEAQAVRIVAPIPGKAVVGVEVPNKTREMVYLKEILQDASFASATSKLQVALGKDIKGAPVSVNLSKMPHLLVAGTTGSGKSVAVNGMITSVLYNASPEDVRFIMVDPKMLELSIYEGIPHLLLPVVTDPKKANLALRWAVDEMERRYELLAKTGVRDIASYNARIERPTAKSTRRRPTAAAGEADEEDPRRDRRAPTAPSRRSISTRTPRSRWPRAPRATRPASSATRRRATRICPTRRRRCRPRGEGRAGRADDKPTKLPYIVIVIDEFADLMMVAPKDVETSVARLAQKARAAGLHLILATQRPSVDVITGLIKANFPSRIALQVASSIDSRTILDQPGAETLLGNGDMLFSDRGTKLRRIHGAFLSDDEVHRVVEFLKQQAKPVYDMDILKPREEDARGGRRARQRLPRRALRPGGRDRVRHAPGVGLVHPAAAADRLQPRRAHGRADGARRHRRPDQRRQAARGAGARRRVPEPRAWSRSFSPRGRCEAMGRGVRIACAALAHDRSLLHFALGGHGPAAAGRRPPRRPRRRPRLDVKAVVAEVQKRYDAAADFRARFTQTLTSAALGRKTNSSGEVTFKKPGRMRWDYEKPDKSQLHHRRRRAVAVRAGRQAGVQAGPQGVAAAGGAGVPDRARGSWRPSSTSASRGKGPTARAATTCCRCRRRRRRRR